MSVVTKGTLGTAVPVLKVETAVTVVTILPEEQKGYLDKESYLKSSFICPCKSWTNADEKDQLHRCMSDNGVCKTALATPGLLIKEVKKNCGIDNSDRSGSRDNS